MAALVGLGLALLTLVGCRPYEVQQEAVFVETSTPPLVAAVSPELAGDTENEPVPQLGVAPETVADAQVIGDNTTNYGYTHQRADGNRLVPGRGTMPETRVIDIPLMGRPAWIVAAPIIEPADHEITGAASVWVVVLDDGRVQAFIFEDRRIEETEIGPDILADLPPLLRVSGHVPALLAPPSPAYGPSLPAILDDAGSRAVVAPDGTVTVLDRQGALIAAAESRPLPDARLLSDEQGRLLFLSDPTTRYDHGIAGDDVEAAAVTLLDPWSAEDGEVIIPIPEPAVIEGIMPLWADLNGDGSREIIVTQSDAQNGAQIIAYNESGEQVAAGPAIGRGYRWRHQLAVAPFGPDGEVELVDVLTPHIGGVVEFYQMVDDELQIVAQVPGFTSHVIGSRNLDMALAGDLDGEGTLEILLPNQARTELGAIRRTADGADVAWRVPLDGVLSSNLAGVTLADGYLMVGAGRDDGTLRLWAP